MAWGLAALDQLGPALLYLLLAWPLPYLTIDNRILPALTDITVSVTRVLLPLLPGAIAADPVDATLVYVTYHGQTTSLVLAQECVGINGALGLVTIALPFALLAGGTNLARGKWLLMGLVLSWLANVMRILLIVLTAAFFGPDVALNLLHPILGMILFGLSFALLLSLAPLCGLDVAAPFRKVQHSDPVPHTTSDLILLPQPSEAPQQRWWGVLRLVLLLLAILGAGTFMENDLNKLSWLSESTLPHIGAARADDLFHAPPGWRVDDLQSMDSWQVQFGSDAVAAVLDISSPSQGSVGVQAIMARDAANFASYNVENCYVFHGYAVQGAHAVMLGNGVTGKVIDFKAEGQATAALYWLQPVQTPNGLYHERVLLIEDTMPLHVARFRPVAQPSLPQRVASAMLDLLSPWGLAQHADPAYTAMNNQLQDLATIVVAREGHAAAFSQ